MDSIVQWLAEAHAAYPIVGALVLMMLLDVLAGICAAVVTRSVSSTVSYRGMARKAIMLILVGVGAALEPYSSGLPLSRLVAMAFLVTEAISILENAARAGVPVPALLQDLLIKLKSGEKPSVDPPDPVRQDR